jgi:drug/metabolite transporter (DMT)-like permease
MQIGWLTLAIVATVGYHLVLKLTPPAVSPFLSLAATYATGSIAFLVIFALSRSTVTWQEGVRLIDWTAIALAVAVVALDLGFLLLYRSGFNVSLGQLVTQSAAALILLLVGVAFFRDRLSAANVAGILLCVGGLWLINRR